MEVSIQTQNSSEARNFLLRWILSRVGGGKSTSTIFDIGEIFGQNVAAEVLHTESLSKAVYREALDSMGVPRAAEKGASREAVGITMGQRDRRHQWTTRATASKNLDHVSLTAWLLRQ